MSLLVPVCAQSPDPSPSLDTAPLVQWFDGALESKAKELGIPGFAAGVIHKGNVVMKKLYGVRSLATGEVIEPHTVFQLGSVSKTLTGALMGVLLQKQMIHFEKPISPYVSNFDYCPETLTLKHVLTHTSGLPRFGFNSLIESEQHSRDGIFNRLARATPLCEPGMCYDYHNAAFGLVAPVVEKVTSQSFEDSLHSHVFEPLDMKTASASHQSLLEAENRASPHQKTKTGYTACSKYRHGYYEVAPAGGVNASLEDMLKFLNAMMGHRPDIIKPDILQVLHTPYTPAKDLFEKNPGNINRFKSSSYGIGFRIVDYEGHRIIFHGGWVKGFINIIAFMPEKDIGLVILQNAETAFPWTMAMSFFDKVIGIEGRVWEKAPLRAKKSTQVRALNIAHKKAHSLKTKRDAAQKENHSIKRRSHSRKARLGNAGGAS